MLKILIMSLCIFGSFVFFDTQNAAEKEFNDKTAPNTNAAVAVFFDALPAVEDWPSPLQKIYTIYNMDNEIKQLRETPGYTPLNSIPKNMRQALIAIEDHSFYEHGAIAIDGIARAALVNLSAGEVVQGGSTLTQQFVKNVFLTQEQSMERKITEAVLALLLENKYGKDDILELYLNTTYFGAGATGIDAASRVYFNKAPQELSLEECAVIAALPYAPSALNPLENPQGCKKRQRLVLDSMQKYGYLSAQEAADAKNAPVALANGITM